MPMYEYRCDGCGATFEVLRKFSDPEITVHQSCGAKVVRLISAAGLHFKGSGWYITDYARSGAAKEKNGDGKTGETPAPAKTETKVLAPSTSGTAEKK